MKSFLKLKLHFLFVVLILMASDMLSQTSALAPTPDEVDYYPQEEQETQQKKEKKRKDEFKVYAGINFNKINLNSEKYSNTMGVGWSLGASYKRGKFFYWELGARYNSAGYNLNDLTISSDSSSLLDGIFSVRNIDIPISFGINILSVTSRIVGLRVFVSAVPSFAIGIGGNDLDISMDKINTFNLYGQAGAGVDVTFIFIELGANYGFQDLFEDYSTSNPYQIYLNLGFRF